MLRTCLLAGAASGALCAIANAQTTSSFVAESNTETETWRADVIIVDGRRRAPYSANDAAVSRVPVPLDEIAQSIQVLTPTLLREQELNTLSDALINVSGVVPSQPSEIVLANPIVRGFEAEIYVDGLMGYGDTAVLDPASLVGVERIEVAKGPTSVLFGGGTGAPVGGLINIVTKTPQEEAFARIGLRAGSFATVAPTIDVNIPLSDTVGLRLPAEYFRSDDYIDAVEIERITLNPSLGAALSEKTDALLRVGYNRVEQLEYVGLPAEVADVPGVDRFQFTSAPDAPDTVIENLTVHGSLTHRFSDVLSATVQVRRFSNSFDEFSSSPFFAFFPIEGNAVLQIRGSLPADVRQWTADASITATFETGALEHTLLVGATYDDTNYDAATGFDFFNVIGPFNYVTQTPELSFDETPPLVNFLESDYKTIAGYVQDHVRLGDRVSLMVGGRLSEYQLIELEGGQGTDQTFTRFDPRLGATIELIDGLSAFAGWSTGSRLSLFFASADGAPPELETSRSIEGGVKFSLKGLGLSGTLAGFQIVRENVPTPDPTTFITSIQTGEQRSVGAEIDLVWEPSPQLSVLMTTAYTDAEITEDTTIPAGASLPRAPEYSGRLAARYRFDGALEGLGVGAGVTFASEADITLPNSFDSDAYAVLDAQVSYEIGVHRIGVTVQNLADTKYFTPYQYFNQAVVRPGAPRSAFVTLSTEF
ncbi:MAG: TonB-dependent siderophore receptor [Pseudomonadota bacterium]